MGNFSLAFYLPQPFAVYKNGEARSGMPLGGLGTGYIELLSSGAFGNSTVQNNFLHPTPLPQECYLFIEIDGKHIPLRSDSLKNIKFFGHFPIAELSYKDPQIPFPLQLKAFSPFIKGDSFNSSLPSAFFKFLIGKSSKHHKLKAGISWAMGGKLIGNLAGAFAWKKDFLQPGEELNALCAIWVGEKHPSTLKPPTFNVPCDSERKTLKDEITSIKVNDWGAFNWEEEKEFTLPVGGQGHLSAIFFSLHWKENSAGVFYSPSGLNVENLQILEGLKTSRDGRCARRKLLTEDGKLELTITDLLVEGVLWKKITLKNVSDNAIENVSFSIFVNLDVGGIGEAENNIGTVEEEGNLLCISDKERKFTGYIKGFDASHYFLGPWQETHNRMRGGKLKKIETSQWEVKPVEDGGLLRQEEGEYAICFPKGKHKIGYRIDEEKVQVFAECDTKENREILLVLSWFFPNYISTGGQKLGHFYANSFKSASEVAEYSLTKADEFLRKIEEWQSEIYSSEIPLWLKDALINGLYPIVKNSLFTQDGRFSLSESFTGCPINETLVCRFNGSFPLLLFFPELEMKVMKEFAKLQKDDGEIPFCFGPEDNFSSPTYHLQHPIVSSEFIIMVWRDYVFLKDMDFLKEMYPIVKKALYFVKNLDRNGDYLVEEDPQPGGLANQYYDVWEWKGVSSYVNSILLSALKAISMMAGIMNDEETKRFADELFERAQEQFQEKLWNGRWFNLYSDDVTSETCLANQLVGQWYAYVCGLGEILPREKVVSAIKWIGEFNCKVSPYGVVNGVTPEGKPDETGRNHQSDGISPGEGFAFAVTAIYAGESKLGLWAGEKIYRNIAILRKSPWNIFFNYLSSTGEECWGSDYYSNMSVWTFWFAMKGGKSL